MRNIFQGFMLMVCAFTFSESTLWAADNSTHSGLVESQSPVLISILHTNDLHSHFRGEKAPMPIGGVARLKTAIQQMRSENPNTLLVDGGDWSEGSVYYNEGTGLESLRMMDRLGYDVAAVGNHDWLNGPDHLLGAFEIAQPKTKFVSANLSSDKYRHTEEFKHWVHPYEIREVGGVKVAFIGISTYELIYDNFFAPVQVLEPFRITHKLSKELKTSGKADVVVVISHNSILMNKGILKYAPNVDLVVGAHDHVKLIKPVEVSRWPWGNGSGWIVEAGSWGRYLGRVDIKVSADKKVELVNYQLKQMDSTVPEDPEILSSLEELENRMETRYGPIFHDEIGTNELELNRLGLENGIGNLVTDAYLKASQADFAIDSTKFIYGELHPGPLTTADVINTVPAVYSPTNQKTWTLKVLPIAGKTLKRLLYLLFATNKLSSYGLINVSGLQITYDPWFLFNQYESRMDFTNYFSDPMDESIPVNIDSAQVLNDIRVQGQPFDTSRTYRVALGNGLIDGFRFLNSYLHVLTLEGLEDTGIENWKVLVDYIRTHSPLTREKVPVGNRIKTAQTDLGILYEDIVWEPLSKTSEGILAKIRVRVTNFGSKPSQAGILSAGPKIHLLTNKFGVDYAVDPEYSEIGAFHSLRSIGPNESQWVEWEAVVPEYQGLCPVTVKIEGNESQPNHTHDEITRWFKMS